MPPSKVYAQICMCVLDGITSVQGCVSIGVTACDQNESNILCLITKTIQRRHLIASKCRTHLLTFVNFRSGLFLRMITLVKILTIKIKIDREL